MDHIAVLERTYHEINGRSTPIAQPALLTPVPEYCRAVWALGDWTPTPAFDRFMDELAVMCRNRGIIYDVKGTAALLHWTLMQLETFPVSTHDARMEEACQIRSIIADHPPFTITFKGICKTRNGLFLCGYPSFDVNKIRGAVRAGVRDMKEPHPQDICHATLFRLTDAPSPAMTAWFDSLHDRYAGVELLQFVPRRWEYGFGTWRQTDRERKIVLSWSSAPRWILHRGLGDGPDARLENDERRIRALVSEGWDVEVDLWKMDDGWWLGHDAPTAKLSDISVLEVPQVWAHCKNLEALQALQATRESGKIHYFTHDTDPATLTSRNWIWCFPGRIVGKGSVCVMPERTGLRAPEICMAGAVCSDYKPSAFY